jgi:DNA polymerase III subunit alpha
MIVALDLETSGLPAANAEIGSQQYPWAVSAACVLFNFDGRDLAIFGSRIRADGRTISPGAQAIHGISAREAGRSGIPEVIALGVVCSYAAEARYIVGFNIDFDRKILESALIRLGKDPRKITRPGLQLVDLMKPAAAFCRLPSEHHSGGYKWPTLSDALQKIRNERPRTGQHDALRDAMAAKRLFLSLHHRKALDVTERAA